MKPKEQYTAPRDRAFGSSAWARKADTIMDITMDQETQVRYVQLLLRTGKAQLMEFEFRPGSGLLHQRQERLVPKIVVGEEKELTVRALASALHIGKNRAAELLRSARMGRVNYSGRRRLRTRPRPSPKDSIVRGQGQAEDTACPHVCPLSSEITTVSF